MVSIKTMRFHANAKPHENVCGQCSTDPCRSCSQRTVRNFGHAGLPKSLQYSSVQRLRIVDLCIVRLLLIRIEICGTFMRSSEVDRSVRTCQNGGLCIYFTCRICAFTLIFDNVGFFAAETCVGQYVGSFVTKCNFCKSWDASHSVTITCHTHTHTHRLQWPKLTTQ